MFLIKKIQNRLITISTGIINRTISKLKPFFLAEIIKNFLSMGLASIINSLIGLITLGYSARVLGPENYGLAIYAASITAYAGLVLTPGLVKWGTRAVAQDQKNAGKILISINLLQIILATLAYIALYIYGINYLLGEEFLIVMLYGLNLFITAITVDWVCYGLELMRYTAWLSVLSSSLSTIGLLLLIKEPAHLYRLPLLGFFVPFIIQLILYLILINKIKIIFSFPSYKDLSNIYKAAIPLSVISIITVLYRYANNILIKEALGVAFVGIFFAAYRLVEISTSIVQMANVIFYSRLSKQVINSIALAQRDARLYIRGLITFGIGVGAFLFSEANGLIQLIYGINYQGAEGVLKILSLIVVLGCAAVGYSGSLIPFNKDNQMLRVIIAMAITAIAGGVLIIPSFGLAGAAWVLVLTEFVGLIFSFAPFKQAVGSLELLAWAFPITGAIIVILVSFILQNLNLNLWFRFPIEAIVYLPFLFFNIRPILNQITEKRNGN